MKFDTDSYREILDTISRNKSRSFLTGFGVFWGIFMLVVLIGGGQGLKQLLSENFEGFATNSSMIFAQPTTKAYDGFRKGRGWHMSYSDIERLSSQVPQLDVVSPVITNWGGVAIHGNNKSTCSVKGLLPDYAKVEAPEIKYGRFLNDIDMAQRRKVCVLGKRVYQQLFPGGGDPCGEYVRIDSIYYQVVGVNFSSGNMSVNGSSDEAVVMPITLMQQAYNRGDAIDMIVVTGKQGVTMSGLANDIRGVIARQHRIDPTDEHAITVFNSEVMFKMVDSLFIGVNFLVWLVGIGTLLAGAIGVSNIMMVTVRERTIEIGIRRAIGATPSNILSQIMLESVLLTAVAGVMGILFGILVLNGLELGTAENGEMKAQFVIGFWTAIFTTSLLVVLGVLAGLAPAFRAMGIKPVDAMRDE